MTKQFTIILVITFFAGMTWLTFDIIFNTKPSIPLSPKLETLLEPVNPNFNSRVLETIDQETIDSDTVVFSQPLPTELASPEPEPTALTGQDSEGTTSAEINL